MYDAHSQSRWYHIACGVTRCGFWAVAQDLNPDVCCWHPSVPVLMLCCGCPSQLGVTAPWALVSSHLSPGECPPLAVGPVLLPRAPALRQHEGQLCASCFRSLSAWRGVPSPAFEPPQHRCFFLDTPCSPFSVFYTIIVVAVSGH